MQNKNSQTKTFTIFIKTFVFHVKNMDCRSPPRLPASYHCSRITPLAGNNLCSTSYVGPKEGGCSRGTGDSKLTAPGKPSTLFPGEELVTQTWSFNLCMNMFRECPRMFKRRNVYHFESFQKFSKFDPKLVHRVTFPRR